MAIKEKLVELLCDGTAKTETCDLHQDCATAKGDCGFCTIMADHLISNGVTVQEWISVDERLPEEDGCYLTYAKDSTADFIVTFRFAKDGTKVDEEDLYRLKNVWYDYGEYGYYPIEGITHWMPLPEPPKGE